MNYIVNNFYQIAISIVIACFTAWLVWKTWSRTHRITVDKAWLRYRCSTDREIDIQCYHHYMPFISTSIINGKEVIVDNSKTYKETFKNNVYSLLKFAKKT